MPLGDFGPFSVQPQQIARLAVSFTPFVNQLLEAEAAAAVMSGHQLATNYKENVGDGGVDAGLTGATETDWVPAGESVWQFKAGDLTPAKCKKELKDAAWAQERVRNGAKYRLVVGAELTPNKIAARKAALIAQAAQDGLPHEDGRFEVLDGAMLARWATLYPGLAVSRLLNGAGMIAVDHATWARSNRHRQTWVEAVDRTPKIEELKRIIADRSVADVRIDGVSGVGKTRLVLEALRSQPATPLVAYIGQADALTGEYVNHLLAAGRSVVLVVDECGARRHEKIAEQIPHGEAVKLVSLGEPDAYSIRAPIINLSPLSTEGMDEFLKVNYATLWPEARRVIVDLSDGNPRFAIMLADRLRAETAEDAAALIQANDIAQFVTRMVPEGSDFLGAALLALFDRVGWDRDRRYQMETLATFAGWTQPGLDRVVMALKRLGFIETQGRYRSLSPHPLATYLAAEAWREYGSRIASELLPTLDDEMSLSLFKRVADLGRFEPAQAVLRDLLSTEGPFGTLEKLEASHQGRHLTQLAIVLPEEATKLLTAVVDSATTEDLRSATTCRRNLVWTLEKLVWHRRTFSSAAHLLLRLALAENESFGNNATGTWVSLFGAFLPATAATTDQRLDYLESLSTSGQIGVQELIIKACARMLAAHHESITVSGELQGGAVVEERGRPATWGEVAAYRKGAIAIMQRFIARGTPELADESAKVLIGAVHGLLDDGLVGDTLSEALLGLPPKYMPDVRHAVTDLLDLYRRTGSGPERAPLVERLQRVYDSLPKLAPLEKLKEAVRKPGWDDRGEHLAAAVAELMRDAGPAGGVAEAVNDWLREGEVQGAWELGYALALTDIDPDAVHHLAQVVATNGPALVGFLTCRVAQGDAAAFDLFLDGPEAVDLTPIARLVMTVRGPATIRARERVRSLIMELPVVQGARGLFGWHPHLASEDFVWLLSEWLPRIASSTDYMAVLDWFGIAIYRHTEWPHDLVNAVWRLVIARRHFVDVGQERWGWARLAERFMQHRPLDIAELVLDLIENGLVMLGSDEEAQLLAQATDVDPQGVWNSVASRLASSWKTQLAIRGWFTDHVPAEIIRTWVNDSLERAQVVAAITGVGSDTITPVGQYLLTEFPEDDKIRSSLYGDFISGSWMGPESDRITGQIAQLEGWLRVPNVSAGVRRWVDEVIDYLKSRRSEVLDYEAEERW